MKITFLRPLNAPAGEFTDGKDDGMELSLDLVLARPPVIDTPPIQPPPVIDPPPVGPPPVDDPAPPVDPPPVDVEPPPAVTSPLPTLPLDLRSTYAPADLHWHEATAADVVDVAISLDDGTALALANVPLGVTPLLRADGTMHDHLAVARYKDSIVIENCWLTSTQNLGGRLTITVNGAVTFDQPDVQFWLWSRTVPQRTGLPQYTPTPIDPALLPAYGNPGPLKSMAGRMNEVEAGINGKGYATYDAMGATGGRPEIAILPAWDLPYAVQGAHWQDCRDANDHSTVWPVHVRDPATGMPVDPMLRPTACLLTQHLGYNYGPARGRNPITGKTSCPYEPDSAHQTHFSTVPYLATHSDFDLEELEFWSSWQGIWNNASYRGYEKAIVSGSQTRGIAWSLVQYAFAAKLLPEGNPLKATFTTGLANSVVSHWANQYAPGKPKHTVFGFDPQVAYQDGAGRYRGIAPWMNHYLAGALNLCVWYGFTDFTPWRDWSAGFAVGCMTKLCYQMATFYNLWPIPVEGYAKGSLANMVTTWEDLRVESLKAAYDGKYADQMDTPCGEMAIGSMAKGMMSGATGGTQSYPAMLQPALAAGVDAGLPGATEAWAVFLQYRGKIDYAASNENNIVPRAIP